MLNFLWIPACAGMTGSALCHSSESWNPVLSYFSKSKMDPRVLRYARPED
jgi:hypothetical protein